MTNHFKPGPNNAGNSTILLDSEPPEYQSTNYVRAILALSIAMFSMSMGVGFIIPLLPPYAEALGAGGMWIGLVVGVNPLIRGACMPVIGRLSDLGDKRNFLLSGLIGYCFVAVLMGAAVNIWQLFVLRLLQGLVSALVMPVSAAYVGLLAPEGREGSVMSLFNLSFFTGFALGPLLGGVLSDAFGLKVPFLFMGGFALIAFIVVWLFVPSQKTENQGGSSGVPQFREILKNPIVSGLTLGRTFSAMGSGAVSCLLPIYARKLLLLSGVQVGTLSMAHALFASTLQPVGGMLADRFNRKYLSASGLLWVPICMMLIPRTDSFVSMIGVSMLMGLGSGIFIPSNTAIAVVEGRKTGMGSTMGIMEMAMAFGMAFGATAGGVFTQLFSVNYSFYIISAISFLGIFPFLWFFQGYKGHPVHHTKESVLHIK